MPTGVVKDICIRAGLDIAQVDDSLLTVANILPTNQVQGYLVKQPTVASQLLTVLMTVYAFDACESDGKVKFVPRGLPAVLTIPEKDLGLLADKAKLINEEIGQEQDLPQKMEVLFSNPALDFQQGKQSASRNVRIISTHNRAQMSVPLTLTDLQAAQIAERSLFLAWLERNLFSLNLWRAVYMLIDPTDVIEFVYRTLTFQIRVTHNNLGSGYVIAINGVSEDARNFISSLTETAQGIGVTSPPPRPAGNTLLNLFDIPLLRDADNNPGGTGYYYSMSSAIIDWLGGALYASVTDSNFTQEDIDNFPVNFGVATTTLGVPRSPWTWDRTNSLTIQMLRGTLAGDTALNVLNGSNALLVGAPGRWETIQFKDAVQNSDGTVTVKTLTRGRRGTEWARGLHQANDIVVVPITGLRRVQEPSGLLNINRYYRAVTVGQDITSVTSQQFTITGEDDMPYAPAQISGTRQSGDLAITWLRRTRVGGDWIDNVGAVPLSETAELYDVDILNGTTVVRTFTDLPTPEATYLAADQATDFGSPQAAVSIRVYQRSSLVGRGFAATATV